MKFLLGLAVGVFLMRSGRLAPLEQQIRSYLGSDSPTTADVGHAVARAAGDGAQRAAGFIERAPIPDSVKAPVSDAVLNAGASAESFAQRSNPAPPSGGSSDPDAAT